jgi:hypothetical protein
MFHQETEDLLDAVVDDDGIRVLAILNRLGTPNVTIDAKKLRLPGILRGGASAASIAAFFGAVQSFRVFINLAFDHNKRDSRGRTVVHFACAGGNFEILRELDNLGVRWTIRSWDGTPAEMGARFGRLPVLQWLWTKGALLGEGVGWRRGDERDEAQILRWAAEGGHGDVIRVAGV